MSEEEMQRKMEFIINQQAQFTSDIQILQESQSRLTDAVTTVVGIVGRLATAQEQLTVEQARLTEQMRELTAKQSETDERLNIFVNVVERYISEHRNGRHGRAAGDETDDSAPSS